MCCIGSDDFRVLSFFVAISSYSTFTSVAATADGLFSCYCPFRVGSAAVAVIGAVAIVVVRLAAALFDEPPDSRISYASSCKCSWTGARG